jgi:hypothetical protein
VRVLFYVATVSNNGLVLESYRWGWLILC